MRFVLLPIILLNVGTRDTPHVITCCVETNGLCSTLGVVFWKNLSKPSPLFVQQGVSFSVFFSLFSLLLDQHITSLLSFFALYLLSVFCCEDVTLS